MIWRLFAFALSYLFNPQDAHLPNHFPYIHMYFCPMTLPAASCSFFHPAKMDSLASPWEYSYFQKGSHNAPYRNLSPYLMQPW